MDDCKVLIKCELQIGVALIRYLRMREKRTGVQGTRTCEHLSNEIRLRDLVVSPLRHRHFYALIHLCWNSGGWMNPHVVPKHRSHIEHRSTAEVQDIELNA